MSEGVPQPNKLPSEIVYMKELSQVDRRQMLDELMRKYRKDEEETEGKIIDTLSGVDKKAHYSILILNEIIVKGSVDLVDLQKDRTDIDQTMWAEAATEVRRDIEKDLEEIKEINN